ncbi:hypothetical protein ACFFX0_26580 [Citricoccus parietis]|uniref:Uncharacterized protein n=1 Tax=Citricoccus parietis TaxID=592307 RepID=A0ABV5G821_9MICC
MFSGVTVRPDRLSGARRDHVLIGADLMIGEDLGGEGVRGQHPRARLDAQLFVGQLELLIGIDVLALGEQRGFVRVVAFQ